MKVFSTKETKKAAILTTVVGIEVKSICFELCKGKAVATYNVKYPNSLLRRALMLFRTLHQSKLTEFNDILREENF